MAGYGKADPQMRVPLRRVAEPPGGTKRSGAAQRAAGRIERKVPARKRIVVRAKARRRLGNSLRGECLLRSLVTGGQLAPSAPPVAGERPAPHTAARPAARARARERAAGSRAASAPVRLPPPSSRAAAGGRSC